MKKIACITLDIEPDLRDPQRRVRMFEDAGLMDKYVTVIQASGIKVTGFLVTSLLETYGPEIDQFSQRIPIEFGVHSHNHDQQNACTREEVDQAFHAHQAFWENAPLGYRAPNGLIDKAGINNLLDYKFQYDASIFPTIRFDEYGYMNLNFPIVPFRFVRGQESLVELPFACLRTIRLVFSLSYAKLLSLSMYRMLMMFFPLPDVVILGSHPYDFYIPLIIDNIKGWKRFGHLRNARRTFDIFEQIVKMLNGQGYEFMYMSELSRYVQSMPDIRQISVDALC